MPTLADLSSYDSGRLGLLGFFLDRQAQDEMFRRAAGLLGAGTVKQEAAKARYVNEASRSVMPGVREQAQRQQFEETLAHPMLGFGAGLLGSVNTFRGRISAIERAALESVPDGFSIYGPSKIAAIKESDSGWGPIDLWLGVDGKYVARWDPPYTAGSAKPVYAISDSADEAARAVESEITKSIDSAAKKNAATLAGRLQREFGDEFYFNRSARSKSMYVLHKPSGAKIRISDHELPMHYESADLELSSSMTDKQKADAITKFLRGADE